MGKLTENIREEYFNALTKLSEIKDSEEKWGKFKELKWEYHEKLFALRREHTTYFEHKTAAYKNGKRKLAFVFDEEITYLEPYKRADSGGTSYGFEWGASKPVDSETLEKHFRNISHNDFMYRELVYIPTNF